MLLYIGLQEGSAGSVLQCIGMPPVPVEPDRALILRAQIGKALDAVSRLEEKLTLQKNIKKNRVHRRWEAYLDMKIAKNRIPEAELRAQVAVWNLTKAPGSIAELQEAEEQLLIYRETYRLAKRLTDKLRKGNIYLSLTSELHSKLRSFGIRV